MAKPHNIPATEPDTGLPTTVSEPSFTLTPFDAAPSTSAADPAAAPDDTAHTQELLAHASGTVETGVADTAAKATPAGGSAKGSGKSSGDGSGDGPANGSADIWASFEQQGDRSWLHASDSTSGSLALGGTKERDLTITGEVILERAEAVLQAAGVPADVAPKAPTPQTAPILAYWVALVDGYPGQIWPVTKPVCLLGRATRNDIVLDHPSLSRQHARLEQQADGSFVLFDSNSGNGTFVGGGRIQRCELTFGQEVAFGQVTLRFEAPTQALQAVPKFAALPAPALLPSASLSEAYRMPQAPAARSKAVRWGRRLGLVLQVLFWLAIPIAAFKAQRWQQKQREVQQDGLFAEYLAAVRSLQAHQFEAAEQHIQQVLLLQPNDVRARHYLRTIGRERIAYKQWLTAQDLYKNNEVERAYALASGILDSTYRTAAQLIMAKVDASLEADLAQAQTLRDVGQVQKLLQKIDTVHPGRSDVAAVLVRADLQSGGDSVTPANIAARAMQRRKHATLPLAASGVLADAWRAFNLGDVSEALRILENVNSEAGASLRANLEKFQEAYDNGQSAYREKRAFNAINALMTAKRLATAMHSNTSNGVLLPEIHHKLADMHYLLSNQAFLSEQWSQSYEACRLALTLETGHALCKRQLLQLLGRAQDMFDQAHATESNKAQTRQTMRTIMAMVAPDSTLYRQAKARLQAAL